MQGKKMVMLILFVCIVAIILVYFWLQDVITEYDLDRALGFIADPTNKSLHIHKTS